MHKLPMKCRFVKREVGEALMANGLVASDLRNSTEEELDGKLARGQDRAVQPPLPGGHRPGWRATGGCAPSASEIARIYTVKRERELGIVTRGGRGG